MESERQRHLRTEVDLAQAKQKCRSLQATGTGQAKQKPLTMAGWEDLIEQVLVYHILCCVSCGIEFLTVGAAGRMRSSTDI